MRSASGSTIALERVSSPVMTSSKIRISTFCNGNSVSNAINNNALFSVTFPSSQFTHLSEFLTNISSCRYVMKKLGNDKMDVDALLDEADRNKDGVIDYDGKRKYSSKLLHISF